MRGLFSRGGPYHEDEDAFGGVTLHAGNHYSRNTHVAFLEGSSLTLPGVIIKMATEAIRTILLSVRIVIERVNSNSKSTNTNNSHNLSEADALVLLGDIWDDVGDLNGTICGLRVYG